MNRSHLRFVAAFVTVALTAFPAPSAEQFRLRIQPTVAGVRSNAPMPVEVQLECFSDQLVEGRLYLSFFDGDRLVGRYQTSEMALTTGTKRFRISLPPMKITNEVSLLTVRGRFIGEALDVDLEEQEFRVPLYWRRVFVIAIAQPSATARSEAAVDLAPALALEQYIPDADLRQSLSTMISRIDPGELPASAAGYAAYDVLLLAEGLAELSSRQLEAIGDWVEAGGSVCVLPAPPLGPEHVQFLNRLAGEAAFVGDAEGNFVSTSIPDEKIRYLRTGLGRAVIITRRIDPMFDLDTREWRGIVGFLWKLRHSQTSSLEKDGQWSFQRDEQRSAALGPRPLQPQPLELEEKLADLLLPDQITGIPMPVVISILALFLIAVAPGDYLVLGWLKARRYTWLLFFVVSLAFTGFTVNLAGRYMSSADFGSELVLVDWAGGDRAARTTRYELVFTASQQILDRPYVETLHAAIPPRPARMREQYPGYQFYPEDELPDWFGTDLQPPVYEGHMPVGFRVYQEMPKWTPRLSRLTTLGGEALPAPIDWSTIDPEQFKTAEGRDVVFTAVKNAAPEAVTFLLNGKTRHEPPPGEPPAGDGEMTRLRQIANLVEQASRRPAAGLFQIVSQIAPNGHASFEDLSLLDETDPSQWLLVIVARDGDDYVVHRRLYDGLSNSPRAGTAPSPE